MRRIFRNIILIIILGIVIYIGLLYFNNNTTFCLDDYNLEEETFVINNYYIYGNHLNLEGKIILKDSSVKNISLILASPNRVTVPVKYDIKNNIINIYLSEYINDGFNLDDLTKGKYYFLLQIINSDDHIKYYKIINETSYDEATYYQTSVINNNKIVFNSNNSDGVFMLDVTPNKNKNIVDITLDPGHGGRDTGACYKNKCEDEYVLEITNLLKSMLEKYNLKIKLTRGKIDQDKLLNTYDDNGRVNIPNDVHSKYLLSFHLNSDESKTLKGLEILTPSNIDYSFAKSLVYNMVNVAGATSSNKKGFKMYDGIYSRLFDDNDIESTNKEVLDKGLKAYDVDNNTEYYYILRETGGIITGAYVDGRDKEVGKNYYVNSNVGVESYIIELGYIYNTNDVNNIETNLKLYAEGIKNAIIKELNID